MRLRDCIPRHVVFALLFFSANLPRAHADEEHSVSAHLTPPESKNRIISFTDQGINPARLEMKLEDYSVFFLNKSLESLATIEIDYQGKTTHCASGNLEITAEGVVQSSRPLPPKDFASVCFHDRGTYPFRILGLKRNPRGLNGTIVVE